MADEVSEGFKLTERGTLGGIGEMMGDPSRIDHDRIRSSSEAAKRRDWQGEIATPWRYNA